MSSIFWIVRTRKEVESKKDGDKFFMSDENLLEPTGYHAVLVFGSIFLLDGAIYRIRSDAYFMHWMWI